MRSESNGNAYVTVRGMIQLACMIRTVFIAFPAVLSCKAFQHQTPSAFRPLPSSLTPIPAAFLGCSLMAWSAQVCDEDNCNTECSSPAPRLLSSAALAASVSSAPFFFSSALI